MAILEKEKFKELAEERTSYCVSVYIGTSPIGENRESILALKNQSSKIGNQLLELGLPTSEIDVYLEPIRELIGNTGMWRFMAHSLAVFRSPKTFFYTTLPFGTEELSVLSDRFHLMPLLNVFHNDHEFLILRLSLNGNKLYRANMESITEIPTENIFPENLQESVGVDNEKTSLQFRGGQTGEGLGLYGGIGRGKDLKPREIQKYLQYIDNGLSQLLDNHSMPLVVASVENVFSIFRNVTSYKNVYPECIAGNYDHVKDHVLHEKALDILQPYFEREKHEDKHKYRETAGKVIANVDEVIRSAYEGKIDTLFVAKGEHVWGSYDPSTRVLRKHEDRQPLDYCLIDQAAQTTFLKGGKVYIENKEDLPQNITPVNAILRY